tara:strand:+ start:203 stop:502 length:300 start_codon:yes stop_codon:yes gene_type:complete
MIPAQPARMIPAQPARMILTLPDEKGVVLLDPEKFKMGKIKVLQNLWGLCLRDNEIKEVLPGFNIEDKDFDTEYYDKNSETPCHTLKTILLPHRTNFKG